MAYGHGEYYIYMVSRTYSQCYLDKENLRFPLLVQNEVFRVQ